MSDEEGTKQHWTYESPWIEKSDLPYYKKLLDKINDKVDKQSKAEKQLQRQRKARVLEIVSNQGHRLGGEVLSSDSETDLDEDRPTISLSDVEDVKDDEGDTSTTLPISSSVVSSSSSIQPKPYKTVSLEGDVKPILCLNAEYIPDRGARLPECQVCHLVFQTPEDYTAHFKKVHSEELPFRCTICPKIFKTATLLRQHTRNHGERIFKCPECPKDFVFQVTLTRHMRTHSGERPFTCFVCSKGFLQEGNLVNHMVTHNRDRTHECISCGDKFFRRDVLVRHCRTKGHIC